MSSTKSILAIAIACCSAGALAQVAARPPSANIPQLGQGLMRDQADKIKAVKKLPVRGLSIIETVDGKIMLVSDNGRLAVIGGRMVDLWEGKNVHGIDDAASFDKVNLARMGINVDEFSPFVIGSGVRQVVVFMDPISPKTAPLMAQMAPLGSKYTFKVVLLPLTGQASGVAARRIVCAPDKSMGLSAMLTKSTANLPNPAPECDVGPVQKAMITATVLGIKTTPFLILPDFTTTTPGEGDLKLSELLTNGQTQ